MLHLCSEKIILTEILSLKADIEYIFPLDRFYLTGDYGHTWAKPVGVNKYRVGLDSLGVAMAGDILYIKARKIGKKVNQFKALGTVESSKWIGPILQPFTGIITEVNETAIDSPEIMISDPYEIGWIVEIEVDSDTFQIEQENDLIISVGDRERLEKYIKEDFKRFELV